MDIMIKILSVTLLATIFLAIRQGVKIGSLKSFIKNEDKRVNSLMAEIDVIKKEHEESVSSLNERHRKDSDRLNKEIKRLNNHIKNPIKFNKTVLAKVDFDVFE